MDIPERSKWPFGMLWIPGKEITLCDAPVSDSLLLECGVGEFHSLLGEGPRVVLLLFEFENQSRALAEREKIQRFFEERESIHYSEFTVNGAWLLLAGFPSDKPPSPQMEDARTAFLSAFAGEE